MVRRPKETVWEPRSFRTHVFVPLGLLTLRSLDFSLLWVTSVAPVSLCDLSSGGCCEGPGTLVWHPDCGVSCWAEESSKDSVTSQPCPRTPGLVSSCCPWGAELSQSSLPNCSSIVQVGKRLLPCTDLGRMEAFCPDLESGALDPSTELLASIGSLTSHLDTYRPLFPA